MDIQLAQEHVVQRFDNPQNMLPVAVGPRERRARLGRES